MGIDTEKGEAAMHSFIDTILTYCSKAVGPALLAALLGGVPLFRYCERQRKQGRPVPKRQATALLLLMCYLGGLVTVTLLLRMGGGGRMPVQTCFPSGRLGTPLPSRSGSTRC